MMGGVNKTRWLSCVFFLLTLGVCCAATALGSTAELDAEHHRGIELARAGHHDEALALFGELLKKYPDYYPVERDIIIVTAWKGDCRAAVRAYERIRDYPNLEPYLILPVSECLTRLDRHDEALALLSEGKEHWPDDSPLLTAYATAQASHAA